MKTIKHYLGALKLAILGAFSLFSVGPTLGAKQGTITAPTGADANLVTLGATQPVRDTLMGITRAAFQLASALKIAIVNFGARKVVLVPGGQSMATIAAVANTAAIGVFTLEDGSKKTGPWNVALAAIDGPMEALLTGIIAQKKPSFSVETLGNAIEDLEAEEAATFGAKKLFMTVDQNSGEVTVYRALTQADADAAHAAAVALDEDVQFVQTLDAGGGQFGE